MIPFQTLKTHYSREEESWNDGNNPIFTSHYHYHLAILCGMNHYDEYLSAKNGSKMEIGADWKNVPFGHLFPFHHNKMCLLWCTSEILHCDPKQLLLCTYQISAHHVFATYKHFAQQIGFLEAEKVRTYCESDANVIGRKHVKVNWWP